MFCMFCAVLQDGNLSSVCFVLFYKRATRVVCSAGGQRVFCMCVVLSHKRATCVLYCVVLFYRRATCVLYVCCAVLQEGNVFCTTLEPRLFTIDLNTIEHKVFFTELLNLCEAEDGVLLKLPCYKTVTDLVPLRKSAMGTYVYEYTAAASCHYIAVC